MKIDNFQGGVSDISAVQDPLHTSFDAFHFLTWFSLAGVDTLLIPVPLFHLAQGISLQWHFACSSVDTLRAGFCHASFSAEMSVMSPRRLFILHQLLYW